MIFVQILDTASLLAEGSSIIKRNIFKEKLLPQPDDTSTSTCCWFSLSLSSLSPSLTHLQVSHTQKRTALHTHIYRFFFVFFFYLFLYLQTIFCTDELTNLLEYHSLLLLSLSSLDVAAHLVIVGRLAVKEFWPPPSFHCPVNLWVNSQFLPSITFLFFMFSGIGASFYSIYLLDLFLGCYIHRSCGMHPVCYLCLAFN